MSIYYYSRRTRAQMNIITITRSKMMMSTMMRSMASISMNRMMMAMMLRSRVAIVR